MRTLTLRMQVDRILKLLSNTINLAWREESNWDSLLSNGTVNNPGNPPNNNTGIIYGIGATRGCLDSTHHSFYRGLLLHQGWERTIESRTDELFQRADIRWTQRPEHTR